MTTHSELCHLGLRWLRNHGCMLAATELPMHPEQPDVIGFNGSGTSHLIEVKVSRSDFLRDSHKSHRKAVKAGWRDGLGHYRYYLTTPGVINPDDDLAGWGHLELTGRGIKRIRKNGNLYFSPCPTATAQVWMRLFRVITTGRDLSTGIVNVSYEPWPMAVIDVQPTPISDDMESEEMLQRQADQQHREAGGA